MAFGRDGSEVELHSLDLQNRIFKDALRDISSSSKEKRIIEISRKALKEAKRIGEKYGYAEII